MAVTTVAKKFAVKMKNRRTPNAVLKLTAEMFDTAHAVINGPADVEATLYIFEDASWASHDGSGVLKIGVAGKLRS